ERLAFGDRDHQGREAITLAFYLLHYLIDRTAVLHGKFSPQPECEHFFGQAAYEFLPPLVEHLRQFQRSFEFSAARQLARGIDRKRAIGFSPAADSVEVL